MSNHPVTWQSPQPLWSRFGSAADAAHAPEQARPAILRFSSDDFMDQMLGTLARDPSHMASLIAEPETWRKPAHEPDDLIARTPLPSLTQSAARSVAQRKAKPRVMSTQATEDKPLKLYQPAHQRHYLVGASLVCAQHGLPERAVVAGGAEQVNFVLRRVMRDPNTPNDATPHEFAFMKDANGARWQRIAPSADAGRAVPGEDLLPTFALAFQDDLGFARKLWSGSVPVGRREEYMAAPVDRTAPPDFAAAQRQALAPQASSPAPNSKLARTTQFQMEVAEPWKNMIRSAFKLGESVNEDSQADGGPESPSLKTKRVYDFNLQQQNVSWLILLDLADYLDTYLYDLWLVVQANGAGASSLSSPRQKLHSYLATASMPAALSDALGAANVYRAPLLTLGTALKAIRQSGVREALEAAQLNYDNSNINNTSWPPFHFLMAGLTAPAAVQPYTSPAGPFTTLATLDAASAELTPPDPLLGPPVTPATTSQQVQEAARAAAQTVDQLTSLVARALDDAGDKAAPPLPYALKLKNALAKSSTDPGWFVVRFVYGRLDCGPLHLPVVSAPTEPFQLANFFDSDAPARPVRITLPMDTSPAGLRKFNKNTAFVISDMLCGQIQRAKGLGLIDLVRSVLPWPLHKDLDVPSGSCQSGGINIGMICSLSIPIITICALILLIIIVSLLDIIFRWLPYFIICFPVPGLKGKKP
jgi:hypothetical protein